MKKLFTILAVALCSMLAMAQTNQYFWAGGQFIMGNPINQIDSITFGQLEQTDSILLYLPRTVKVIHDTVIQKEYIYDTMYITIHDTINPCAVPDGAISGKFSVSPTKQVYFSQGNLQYQASTNTWRFAENQWDVIGEDNDNISPTYSGWIDLFGWGTSGWNGSGATCYLPYSSSTNDALYIINNDTAQGLVGNYDKADWGVYNSINGEQSSLWRVLSQQEWDWIYNQRTNAASKRAAANIDGKNGIIFLPDDYIQPNDIPFQSGFGSAQHDEDYQSFNTYSISQWRQMEKNGAVFLPSTGVRKGENVLWMHMILYWTSTPATSEYAHDIRCSAVGAPFGTNSRDQRSDGRAVRLVQEVK